MRTIHFVRPLAVLQLTLGIVLLAGWPASAQTATPTPTATATATPTPTSGATATPGSVSVAVVSSSDVQGGPGETVGSGTFAVTNGTSGDISVSQIEVEASQPQLFSDATLTASQDGTSRENSAGPPGTTTTFSFDPEIVVPTGENVTFTLSLTLGNGGGSALRSSPGPVVHASVSPLDATALWIGIVFVLAGAAGRLDRRTGLGILIAGIFAVVLMHTGCGDDEGRFSRQTVTSVTATDAGGNVPVSGLPATLGTVATF